MRADDVATAVVLEMKSVLVPVYERLAAIETSIQQSGPAAELLITREVAAIRERLAAIETRPPVPGPPGVDGKDGKDGDAGPQGVPGLTYRKRWNKDLAAEQTHYAVGDVVTYAGSMWYCNESTPRDSRPGDGSNAWTLMVKRGDDARGSR